MVHFDSSDLVIAESLVQPLLYTQKIASRQSSAQGLLSLPTITRIVQTEADTVAPRLSTKLINDRKEACILKRDQISASILYRWYKIQEAHISHHSNWTTFSKPLTLRQRAVLCPCQLKKPSMPCRAVPCCSFVFDAEDCEVIGVGVFWVCLGWECVLAQLLPYNMSSSEDLGLIVHTS